MNPPDDDLPTIRTERPATPVPLASGGQPALGSENYHLGREIARGGMGCILEAEDRKLTRTVAAKAVMLDSDMDEATKCRFIREAEVLARLSHPNIVPIYDIIWEDGLPLFYTMKLVKGRTLQHILNELRREHPDDLQEFRLDRLLLIFRKVCDAIAFAHSKGVLHRDLKPENIMVGEFGEVLVMDWGLAKVLNDETRVTSDEVLESAAPDSSFGIPHSSFTAPSGASATLQGAVMGTPKYMSPEQATGQIDELDERSDIFSLGGILYAILTLRPPVEGKDIKEVLEKVKSGGITPPTAFGLTTSGSAKQVKGGVLEAKKITPLPHIASGRVPPALSSVAMKALTLDKSERYQDVEAFSGEIEKFQGGFATEAEQAGLGKQLVLLIKRNKGIFSTAAAAWLLITALAVWFIFNLKAKELRATQAEAVAVQEKEATRLALAKSALSLAEASLREGNGPAMRAALEDVPEPLRDSTWRYLLDQSDTSIARIDTGAEIHGVVAHPRLPHVFAVVDSTGKVTLVNVRTGAHLLEFAAQASGGKRYCLAISPDGEQIAVGSWKKNAGLAIHDAGNGKKLFAWKARGTSVLKFSPDGRMLLQAENDPNPGQLKLWDVSTGAVRWSVSSARLEFASFTSDGRQILVPGGESLDLLSATDGSLIQSVGTRFATAAMIRRDDKRIIASNSKGFVWGINVEDARTVFEFRTGEESKGRLALTSDGTRFATLWQLSDGRQAIRFWNAKTGAPLQTLLGGSGQILDVAAHPLSGELAVCGPESRVWNVGGDATFKLQGQNVTSLAFFGSDDVIYGPDPEGSGGFAVQRLASETSTKPLAWADGYYATISVSADGRFAALKGKGPILLLKREGSLVERVASFDAPGNYKAIRLNPTGNRLVVLPWSAALTSVLDSTTGAELARLDTTDIKHISDLAWLDEERVIGLATAIANRGGAGSEERIVIWNAATGAVVRSMKSPNLMNVLVIAPDGKHFAEAGEDKKVRIHDVGTLEVIQAFRAHDGPITALAWHPTKAILATGCNDLAIRLWDLEKGTWIEELRLPIAAPHSLTFSPSGQRLGAASEDAVSRIWDPPSLRDETIKTPDSKGSAIDDTVSPSDSQSLPPWKRALNEARVEHRATKNADQMWSIVIQSKDFSDCAIFEDATDIRELVLSKTRVSDLSPLAGLPLERVALFGTDVADLQPLTECPKLTQLVLPGEAMDLESLRGSATLEQLSYSEKPGGFPTQSVEAFWTTYDSRAWVRALHASGCQITTLRQLDDSTWEVNLSFSEGLDLSILRGAPISKLILHHTDVSDLSPLAGMPLKWLDIYMTKVGDLTPLKGMPLETLYAFDTKVSDVGPLRGMPLKLLLLHKCPGITDVSPLRECTRLESLSLPPNATKYEFLRDSPGLQRLSFASNGAKPIQTTEEFWEGYNSQAWIRTLRASGVPIKSLLQLEDGTWEMNLEFAENLDLSILRGAPISRLNLHHTPVADLSPLEGMPLKWLILYNTKVSDLGPLKGMPIEKLLLPNTPVTDLSPLRGLPLKHLLLHNCPGITDLSPLKGSTTLELLTLPPNATQFEFLRHFPKLQRLSFESTGPNPRQTAEDFWKKLDARNP